MDDTFISTNYHADCYHCQQPADQHIYIMPNRTDVACGNCGVTRVFIPINEDVDIESVFTKPGSWPVWTLVAPAVCRNCGVDGSHEITVSCRTIIVRCRNCRFTHLFRFNFEYMAKDTSDNNPADVVRGHSFCP